uniref:Uncharacterized protein n=1 Tax=Parascaris univalens TaxID=6257 RepID=A0A915A883_PARUN
MNVYNQLERERFQNRHIPLHTAFQARKPINILTPAFMVCVCHWHATTKKSSSWSYGTQLTNPKTVLFKLYLVFDPVTTLPGIRSCGQPSNFFCIPYLLCSLLLRLSVIFGAMC